MSVLVLVIVFLLTVALGAALAKGVLTLVLRFLIDGQLPTLASFRIAGFLVALIAFVVGLYSVGRHARGREAWLGGVVLVLVMVNFMPNRAR